MKGLLRWKYYRTQVSSITEKHRSILECLLSSKYDDVSSASVSILREELHKKCKQDNPVQEETIRINTSNNSKAFETKLIETINIEEFPLWKIALNKETSSGHLYYFGGSSIGYCQVEILNS